MSERIFISAGEASGDLHGATLVRELRARRPALEFEGLGGTQMAAAGVQLWDHLAERAVMGVRSVVAELGGLIDLAARVLERLRSAPPDLLILIDYPGLNLNLARMARAQGVPVAYYICPQVWAWAPWRVRRIARRADLLLVILPFEEPMYGAEHSRVRYVGNPVFDRLREVERTRVPPLDGELLALLPGSRKQEVAETAGPLLRAARELKAARPSLRPVISCQRAALRPIIEEALDAAVPSCEVDLHTGPAHVLQRQSYLSLVVSGTASLEQAFFGSPLVVVYPVRAWERRAFSLFSVTPYISLVNLIAGREVVPEVLFTPGEFERIVETARPLLAGPARDSMCHALDELRRTRFRPGAAAAASEEILRQLAARAAGSGFSRASSRARRAPSGGREDGESSARRCEGGTR